MVGIPFCDVDYCCYCDWGYRKRTRFWSNVDFRGRLCLGPGCCPNMDGKKHKTTAQQGKNKGSEGCMERIFRKPTYTKYQTTCV